MSNVAVETAAPVEDKNRQDWFEENITSVLHAIAGNATFRSETEAYTLGVAIDHLWEDPADFIQNLAGILPPGAAVAVDPVLATVLKQNADLQASVTQLLEAIKSGNTAATVTETVPPAEATATVDPNADPLAGFTPEELQAELAKRGTVQP